MTSRRASSSRNWRTPKKTGCYKVTMLTTDGSSISANFQLK
jgi:hypothetical protein